MLLKKLSFSSQALKPLTRTEASRRFGATGNGCNDGITIILTISSKVDCTDGCYESTGGFSCGKIGACCNEESE
jgi:hypothetical protein